jgi:phenylalanine-4-hydroxylase
MAVGETVISAFSGLADPNSYGLIFESPKEKTHKINYNSKDIELHKLYLEVREMRTNDDVNKDRLKKIFLNLRSNFPKDWLLVLEIFELVQNTKHVKLKDQLRIRLNELSNKESISHLIQDGIELLT